MRPALRREPVAGQTAARRVRAVRVAVVFLVEPVAAMATPKAGGIAFGAEPGVRRVMVTPGGPVVREPLLFMVAVQAAAAVGAALVPEVTVDAAVLVDR